MSGSSSEALRGERALAVIIKNQKLPICRKKVETVGIEPTLDACRLEMAYFQGFLRVRGARIALTLTRSTAD